jgi:alkanesulfonate monooxygenase SsuD/methylene tetrahydromethanopterin reductase-like flavin-dependent oxidoreductase (luciferase family)
VRVSEARIYTLPPQQPLLMCAAISKETAEWAGTWSDGLLTTAGSIEETLDKMNAFQKNGGNNKPVYLQYSFSYAESREQAMQGAFEQWRSNIQPRTKLADMYKTEHFDKAAENVTMEDVLESIPIFTTIAELMEQIRPLEATGAERIVLHNVNTSQAEFIQDFGAYKRSAG